MDPSLLSELLELRDKPRMRPAHIVGYTTKVWGQYPALIDGPTGAVLKGAVYEVQTQEHTQRLAEYEIKNYRVASCVIFCADGKIPRVLTGIVSYIAMTRKSWVKEFSTLKPG